MISKISLFSCFHDCIDFLNVILLLLLLLLLLLFISISEKQKDKVETMGGMGGSPPKFLQQKVKYKKFRGEPPIASHGLPSFILYQG